MEAIIHHGVVVGGVDGALHHPRLLTTLPTGVWEYVACGVWIIIKRQLNSDSNHNSVIFRYGGYVYAN